MASVVLCCYNGDDYIVEQVRTILASMREGDELIVSDDGSDDNTVSIVQELAAKDDRISVIDGPRRGITANFSGALAHASGDVIFLADQDDIWSRNKVSRVVGIFEAFPEVTGVVHDVRVVDRSLDETAPSYFALRRSGPGLFRNLYKNSYLGTALAFRATLLPYVLPIPRIATMHDVWIGLNIEVFGRGYFVPEVLGLYRRHGSNQTDLFPGSASSILRKRVFMGSLAVRQILRKLRGSLAGT